MKITPVYLTWLIASKLVYYAIIIMSAILGINFSLALMTVASTLMFSFGILLICLITAVGIGLIVREVLYYITFLTKNKTTKI